jgi:hypothetical protein
MPGRGRSFGDWPKILGGRPLNGGCRHLPGALEEADCVSLRSEVEAVDDAHDGLLEAEQVEVDASRGAGVEEVLGHVDIDGDAELLKCGLIVFDGGNSLRDGCGTAVSQNPVIRVKTV